MAKSKAGVEILIGERIEHLPTGFKGEVTWSVDERAGDDHVRVKWDEGGETYVRGRDCAILSGARSRRPAKRRRKPQGPSYHKDLSSEQAMQKHLASALRKEAKGWGASKLTHLEATALGKYRRGELMLRRD